MSLSSTRDGAVTVGEMITAALQKLSVIVGGETATAEDSAIGLANLRRMVRTWSVQGVRMWLTDEEVVTLTTDAASYTLDPRYLEISDGFRRSGTNDTPLRLFTREEYNRLPDKTTSGAPFAVFIDRQLATTKAFVYPVPTGAGDYLYLTGKRAILDPTALSEDLEIPAEWEETIVYNLAVRMAPEFEATPRADVVNIAIELYAILAGQDRQGSIRFVIRN